MIPLSFSEIKKKYKNICFLSFDPQYQKQIDMLLLFFSAAGFNAFMAADFDGLMGKYFNYRLSYGDPTDPKIELREDLMRHKALLKEKGVPIEETDESDTLFVLLNSRRLHSINEEVQISLWKLGLEKECAFYDLKRRCFYKCSGPVLSNIEYHIAWHCNLKCKGCSHYSNLISEPLFGTIDSFTQILMRLRELFDDILIINLVGGEPLLNKDVGSFVLVSREHFPKAEIRLFTNGLLIPQLSEQTLAVFRESKVNVSITNYPPTNAIKARIKKVLSEHGIAHIFNRNVSTFDYVIGETERDAERNFKNCSQKLNHLNDDGRLSVCGQPLFYDTIKHKLEVKRELSDRDWIDIYKERSGYEVLSKLHTPIPYCKYCNETNKVYFQWEAPYTKELHEDDPCLIRVK